MTEALRSTSWVIGRGGLLGRAVSEILQHPANEWLPKLALRWSSLVEFKDSANLAIEEFRRYVQAENLTWNIYWCAGVGSIGASRELLDSEIEKVTYFVERVESIFCGTGARGRVFFASSAGGLYGACQDDPISETSSISPNSMYGEMKLKSESLFERLESSIGCRVIIGRISTIYGVGQNLSKQQGLITTASLSILRHRPLEIFVPLETSRNYIHVADAALIATNLVDSANHPAPSGPLRKIICSPRSLSVAHVLRIVTEVFGRRPSISLSRTSSSGAYEREFVLESNVFKQVEPLAFRSPQIAIAEIRHDLLQRLAAGSI